ncbi:alpha/beta hydrolase [Pseudoalteromonas luteoviolacea]|uniref:alpha/beta hydrolase n=1 Tax=Pseudoalteromonas luteoviolacea TaxID=43657 RepID=UPI001B38C6BF|nr:alpha/beta fold hydrolase [Pseudoalteromonas luteoviolacea]MBQ4837839.1 alpha/beta fold hydrolase [Pseudoalteromonas luteoviolacea]
MYKVKLALLCLSVFGYSQGVAAHSNTSEYNRYVNFNWGECPGSFATPDKRNLCSFAKVPVNWDKPNDKQIDILVSKYPAKSNQPKGQIWFLQGGPGYSASFYAQHYDTTLSQYTQDYDLYILEHRGVGWSTHLECPNKPDGDYQQYQQSCYDALHQKWGDDLFHFNTTGAAQDLAYSIDKSRATNWLPSYVYGASYGTLWAQRFTQVAPQGAQAIILDSIVPSKGFSLDLWDENFNYIFSGLAEYCNADPLCQSKLGNDSEHTIKTLLNKVYSNSHCPQTKFNQDSLQALSTLLMMRSIEGALMPAYYRLARCNSDDVIALNNLHQFIFEGTGRQLLELQPKPKNDYSQVLSSLIVHNEISQEHRSLEARLNYCKDAVSCIPKALLYSRYIQKAVWGDKYRSQFTYTDVHHYIPTLMLNGDLDPQTPHSYAYDFMRTFTNVNQRYIEFPQTPHAVIFESPADTNTGNNCGVDVMQSFLNNIWQQPNTDCIAKLHGLNFNLPAFESTLLFGTENAYDGSAQVMTLDSLKRLRDTHPEKFSAARDTLMRVSDF